MNEKPVGRTFQSAIGGNMKYQLKKGQESFEVVDGEFAGRKFLRGKIYEKIPPREKEKFEKIPVGQAFQPAINQQAEKPAPQEVEKKPKTEAKKVEKPEVKS